MYKHTIVMLGVAAASMLPATGTASADALAPASPCADTAVADPASPPSLLNTVGARAFLQGLVSSVEDRAAQPLAPDASFAAAAQFPGVLDAFLVGTPEEFAAYQARSSSPYAIGATQILEPLVADAMGCARAAVQPGPLSAAVAVQPPPMPGAFALQPAPMAGYVTIRPAPAPATVTVRPAPVPGTVAVESGPVPGVVAVESAPGAFVAPPVSLLDAVGAREVLEALVNRPVTCVASSGGIAPQTALLDTIGVTDALDTMVGRPSACHVRRTSVTVSTTPSERVSLLDSLGVSDLLDGILGD
jgi:hypothetical protein